MAILNRFPDSGLPLPNEPHHFPRLRVPTNLFLRKDQLTVQRHIEGPPRGFDQGDLSVGKLFAELRRQTGGAGLIVSHHAVGDTDLHGWPRFRLPSGRILVCHPTGAKGPINMRA